MRDDEHSVMKSGRLPLFQARDPVTANANVTVRRVNQSPGVPQGLGPKDYSVKKYLSSVSVTFPDLSYAADCCGTSATSINNTDARPLFNA